MRSLIIGLVLGVAWLQMQAVLPVQSMIWLMAASAILFAWSTRFLRRTTLKIPTLFACGAVLGFAWAALFAQHYLAQELPKEWEGRDVTLVGTIDSLPFRFDQGVRFNFAVERVLPVDGEVPTIPAKVALSWYSAFRGEDLQAVGNVEPGERWQLTVHLQRPHGNANPNGFDYEAWLLEQGLRATGYVRADENSVRKNQRLDHFVPGFGNGVEYCRGVLRDRIFAALPDKKYAGVIVALVVGDQREISQSEWKVFSRTGISHLISI